MTENTSNNRSWLNDIVGKFFGRYTTPFGSSFFISWIVWNWKAIVVVLWTKREILDVFSTEFDFVTRNNSYVIPLIFAFLYTSIYPGINAGLTWLAGLWKELNLRASKTGEVRIRNYNLKKAAKDKRLETVVKWSSTIANYETQKEEAKLQIQDLRAEIAKLKEVKNRVFAFYNHSQVTFDVLSMVANPEELQKVGVTESQVERAKVKLLQMLALDETSTEDVKKIQDIEKHLELASMKLHVGSV